MRARVMVSPKPMSVVPPSTAVASSPEVPSMEQLTLRQSEADATCRQLQDTLHTHRHTFYERCTNIVECLEAHSENMRKAKVQREAVEMTNLEKLGAAKERVEGLRKRLRDEEEELASRDARLSGVTLEYTEAVRLLDSATLEIRQRNSAIDKLRQEAVALERAMQEKQTEVDAIRERKRVQMCSLGELKVDVQRHLDEERAAMAELTKRKDVIRGLQSSIEALRRIRRVPPTGCSQHPAGVTRR